MLPLGFNRTQAIMSKDTIRRDMLIIDLEPFIYSKPKKALWTSTFINDKFISEWNLWAKDEDFRQDVDQKVGLLTVSDDARVLEVADNTIDILKSYMTGRHIDFISLAEDYDGVWLNWDSISYHNILDYIYGWDCESTVWFRWCFVEDEATYLQPL